MKILYHHRTRSKDGQYVHIEEMILALRELGHEVVVVGPPSMEKEEFGTDGGIVKMLKRYLPRFCYELMEFAYSFLAYRRLVQAVRKHRPDCLYERFNLFLPAGIWIKRRHRLPMLLEVNSPLFEERSKYDGICLKRFAQWSQRYAWRNADYVLPVTRVLGNIVQKYGVPANRIIVIPNGINARRFDDAPDTRSAKKTLGLEDEIVLGFTGFIREWHGLDKVVDLIANDPPARRRHLLIVGDGPARESLERKAAALNVQDRVTITGIVTREKVAQLVAAFDIALQPAVVEYASPLKLFEYLILGKAIVGPAQPNLREILTDRQNALLFDPNDANGLAKAIQELCDNRELLEFVGKNARETISTMQLTWLANARRVEELFGKLMAHA